MRAGKVSDRSRSRSRRCGVSARQLAVDRDDDRVGVDAGARVDGRDQQRLAGSDGASRTRKVGGVTSSTQ
jgi:hypothetical protein